MNKASVILAVLVSMLLSFSYLPFFEDPSAVAKQIALVFIAIIGLALGANRLFKSKGLSFVNYNKSFFYLVLFTVILAIQSAIDAWSLASIQKLGLWSLTIANAMILLALEPSKRKSMVASVALFLLGFLTVWGWVELVSVAKGFTISHQASYLVSTSLGHRNLFGQFIWLLMMLALPTLNIYARQKQVIRVLFFSAAVLTLLMLARSAWLIALLCVIGLIWHLKTSKLALSVKQVRMLYGALALAILLFIVSLDGWYSIEHHVLSAFDVSQGTMRDRLLLQQRSWHMFLEQPLFGIGAGNWPVAQMAFDQTGMITESGNIVYMRPHNDFLWVFAEHGFFAGLMYVCLFALGMYHAFKQYRAKKNLQGISVLLGWTALLIASLNNFPQERPEFLLALAALIAIVHDNETAVSEKKKWLPLICVGLLILVAAFSTFRYASAQFHLYKGQQLSMTNNFEEAFNQFEKAKHFGAEMDQKAIPVSWHIGNLFSRLGKVEDAKVQYELAIKINPNHPYIYNALGAMYAQERQSDRASSYFVKATELAPKYADAWLNLALINYSNGRSEKAFDQFLEADFNTMNALYEPLGTRLSIERLNVLKDKFPERKLQSTIVAIKNTPDWAYSVLKKSRINDLDFETQVLIDASFYMLSHCDSEADCKVCQEIKDKYIPNQELNLKP
ncbi:MAG: O-antigen ligase family protein [Salibacteraceae bacterium]|nr:O-antigen ligase family protein [Salibacteraceae bacterium]